MSYGGRRYGGRDYGPSPWDSGRAPDRGYSDRRYSGGDASSQLAAANTIIDALLMGNERGLKRRYDERDSYSYNRRPFSSFRRGTQRRGGFNKARGSGSAWYGKSEEKDKGGKKERKESEKKEGEEKEKAEKDDENAEKSETEENKEDGKGTTEEKNKPYDKDWKFRCHLCRQSHETEKEHLEHLKTEGHEKNMSEQKARYKRQTQAIVYKLRAIEEDEERTSRGRYGFCTLCNVGFYGNVAKHNFSRLHKDMRNLKAAFCRYCNMRFIERIQFDEHILTIKHMKLRSKMIKDGVDINKGGMVETLDDDDEEMEDLDYPEEYNGEQALGKQCVRKVIGYFCKICCKFFTEELSNVDTHCKDEEHFNKFVEHAKVRKEEIAKKKEEELAKKKIEDELAKVEENGLNEATGDVTMEDAEDETVDEKELMGDEENGAEEEEKVEEEEKAEEEEKEAEEEKEEEKEESPEPEVVTPTRGRGKGRGRGRGRRSTSK